MSCFHGSSVETWVWLSIVARFGSRNGILHESLWINEDEFIVSDSEVFGNGGFASALTECWAKHWKHDGKLYDESHCVSIYPDINHLYNKWTWFHWLPCNQWEVPILNHLWRWIKIWIFGFEISALYKRRGFGGRQIFGIKLCGRCSQSFNLVMLTLTRFTRGHWIKLGGSFFIS